MGKLKPIGSEKLTGMEKIQRMIEISKYKETVPHPINEDKSIEYSRILPDGNNYQIVKEKNGYVIKKSLNENASILEYLEPMKNRKYYSSYSQAFKRLNLIVKEVNLSLGNRKNISLFEAADEATKYILKFDETNEQDNPEVTAAAPQQAAPQQAAPQQAAPQQASVEPQPTGVEGEELATDMTGMDASADTEGQVDPNVEMEGDDVPQDDETEQTTVNQGEEEPLTFKTIQKFTGKLSQKLRDFSADEENQMSSKDIKYVINSILSALDLNSLTEEDKEQIIGKFESSEEVGDEEVGDEEVDYEETSDENAQEVTPESPEAPQAGEMAEDFDDIFVDYVKNKAVENLKQKYPKTSKFVGKMMGDDEDQKIGEMMENLFSESKVEKVLEKYFSPDVKKEKNNISQRIRKNSSNIIQEVRAKKVVEKYPKAKFLGKTKNSTLVFEINQTKVGVTKNGRII